MAPIDIDWNEMLFDNRDGADVSFTSPAPTAAPRARARGKRKGDTPGPGPASRRPQTRSGGMQHRDVGGGAGERRARLAGIHESPEAADDTVHDGRAPALNVYDWCAEDAEGERTSRKFCMKKKSPIQSGKKNYCQLETNSGGRPRHVGVGGRKPIPVEVMYSSKPCSASFSGHQRRDHTIDPEEVDHENNRWSQNRSSSNRRKEQHQGSSSCYIQKVEDVVLLDDEEMQPDEVDCGTPDKQTESKIFYPLRDDPQAVELSSSDIRCLEPGVYLSSPVINYYIQYIKRTILLKEDKFYIFNTYFYSKLEEALVRMGDFVKLRRWWKGFNIFQRGYIILPIHGMAHWSLIIICIPGKDSDSGPIILHLDSLGMHSSTKIFGAIKRYLEEEWRYLKKNPPPDTSISESAWEDLPRNIHTQIVEVPQQKNEYDCGIFMLYFMERFIREAPERFTRDTLGMLSRSWFNSEDASELRMKIRTLLLEAFESARLDDTISGTSSSDGSDKEDIIKDGELEAVTPSDRSEMVIECAEAGGNVKNDEDFKVAGTEEGSGESGDIDKSKTGIAEVPALDKAPTGSMRHDENVDCVLSEAATFSDSIKDEDPAKASSDSTNAEEEFAIVSPDRLKSREGNITSTLYRDIVYDSCDSDSDDVMIVKVRERRATRRNCLII